MFWKTLVYHASLWMFPPAACLPTAVNPPQPAPLPFAAKLVRCIPGMPCPVAPCPVRPFAVEVHFKGGAPCDVMFPVAEGLPGRSNRVTFPGDGKRSFICDARLEKVQADSVELEFVFCFEGFGKENQTQINQVRISARLNEPFLITSQVGDGETCQAEVTVREALPPPAQAPVVGFPLPATCPATQPAMPAPMPVCASQPATPGQTCVCPLPEPMPVARPVTFEKVPSFRVYPESGPQTTCVPHVACPAQCIPCLALTAVAPAARTVSHFFVKHKEKGGIECRCEDGCVANFQKRTTEWGVTGRLSLSATKTSLHVKGVDWKAYADQIDVREDGRVVLRGNVRLMCDKLGVCASVKAEELCVEVKKGKFEKFQTR